MVATITKTPTDRRTTIVVMVTQSIHPPVESRRRLPTLGPPRNDPPHYDESLIVCFDYWWKRDASLVHVTCSTVT